MTAPIVSHTFRSPIEGTELILSAAIYSSTKARGGLVAEQGELWRRENERDVRVHGEPVPAGTFGVLRRGPILDGPVIGTYERSAS